MSNQEIIGQIIGVIGFLGFVFAFSQKDDFRFKSFLAVSGFILAVHFYLLSSYVGMMLAFLSSIRSFVSIYNEKFKHFSYIFYILYLLSLMAFYSSLVDFLPVVSGIAGTFALFHLSGIKMRLVSLACAFLWLTYNISVGSIGGIMNEIFIILVSSKTIYIMRKENRIIVP